MFKEHENCDSPRTCEFMEMCMSALTIKLATSQVEQNIVDNTSELEEVVSGTGCRHAQAKRASKSTEKLFDKQPPK